MRNDVKLILLLCSTLIPVIAQQTRREVVAPANSAEDTRPNSSTVPSVYAVSTRFDRVVLLRFKYDTDLLAGLESMVKQEGIKNAVILAGAGSVRNYQVHAVATRKFPSSDVFVRDPTGAADIIGMNGYVLGGRVHAHMTLSTGDRAFGGHLEPHTNVFTFAVVTLGVLNSALDLSKFDDETWR